MSECCQNDAGRFAQWVREHSRAVWCFARRICWNDDAADDVTQEVFQRAWQARERYQEVGAARAYLLRIADRLLQDRARRGRRQEVLLDDASWSQVEPTSGERPPDGRLEFLEASQQLTHALTELSPEQRRVLLLRYYSEMTFAEIADSMNIPLNTALSHARRGLLVLRRILAEQAT